MSENELQAKLSIQLAQALAGLKSLSGELRSVKQNVAELSKNTNQFQQDAGKATRAAADGAEKAGKATKSYNDIVAEQVNKLHMAYQKTKMLEEAQKRYNAQTRSTAAPTVNDFRAIDQAKAKAMGFGKVQDDVHAKGRTGLAALHQGWLGIAAGAVFAAKMIGQAGQKYQELQDRGQKSYRQAGGAALSIDQAFQASGAVDVEGLTEKAMQLKGPFSQDDVTGFINTVVRRNPDVGDDRWKTLLTAFQSTATVPGNSQTLANLSALAPGASAGQLGQMTREYTRSSGGRAMGDSESRSVQGLVNTGFFTAPQAMSLVSSLSAYDRGAEVDGLIAKLTPPSSTGNPITDTNAMDAWKHSVGALKGQPGGSQQAIAAVAPALAAELRNGLLGQRFRSSEYRLTSQAGGGAFDPVSLRAESEAGERARERDLQVDALPSADGILRARAEARRRSAGEYRKNAAVRGDRGAFVKELAEGSLDALPFGLESVAKPMFNAVVNKAAPEPSATNRPIQVEIVRDTTIRPLTY